MVDLFQTGAMHRRPDGYGNTLVAQQKAAGIKWATLNIGVDVARNPTVWDHQRKLYRDAGIPHGPWLHCHSVADAEWLISIGEAWNADLIGPNIEDVVSDGLSLQEVGGVLRDFWVDKYEKPAHMATLPWVQNGQGWQHVAFCTFALEMFPLEGISQKYLDEWEKCVDHAFDEGAKKVTLLFSTTSPRSTYPNVAHCLYTADDVTDWSAWRDTVPQPVPKPEEAPPMSDPWYSKPYVKGTAVGPAKLPRVLRFDDPVLQGDDVTAIKRVVSHAQRWLPWAPSQWDNRYSKPFAMGKGTGMVGDSGVRGFQRQEGLAQTGEVNDETYQRMRRARIPVGPRQGDPILDAISAKLINQAIAEMSPAGKTAKVQAAITDFCERAEAVEELWHYTQRRPFDGFGVAPERNHENDCSGYVILAYYWARQVTGILVPDPSKYRYTGYGNTWDDLDGHTRVVSGNYIVGDLANYDGHVTVCRKPGNASTSVWSSFGQEAGPEATMLYYRGDLRYVCRPSLLPEAL